MQNIDRSQYQIPKVFFDKYMLNLDTGTFFILMLFYDLYLKNEGKDISLPFPAFKQLLRLPDDLEKEQGLWDNLKFNNLITIDTNIDKNKYSLNLKQIHNDNLEFSEGGRTRRKDKFFNIIVSKDLQEERMVLPHVERYIEDNLFYYGKTIAGKLRKMFNGVIQYGETQPFQLSILMQAIMDIDDSLLWRVCDAYNNSKKYGKCGIAYIRGIIKNKLNDEKEKLSLIDIKRINDDADKKQMERSDREFGIKIALGQVENSKSYQSHINRKRFKRLKKLHSVGVKYLKSKNREKEIFTGYKWLKEE